MAARSTAARQHAIQQSARVLHKSAEVRNYHAELGFYEGWGTVAAQLAALVKSRVR